MKKGFTFAELMISLVIISIITALLYPTISELAPNNNKHLFKSAYKTIETITNEITNGQNETNGAAGECTGTTVDSATAISTQHNLCCQFNNRLNTVGMTNSAGATINVCDENNQLQTTNGMRWWFDSANSLYVDVNAANNTVTSKCEVDGLPWTKGSFCGTAATQDTFHINISNTGKITFPNTETVAPQHLQNTTED